MVTTKYNWLTDYFLNLSLNSPKSFDSVKIIPKIIIIGTIILNTERNELNEYPSKFGSLYLKWIPVPKAKLKELKSKRVKNPSFKSLLDNDERKTDGLINTDIR